MSHEHSHKHGHHNHQTHPANKRPIHHDWKFWVALVLMLAAMGWYVLSDNESLQPGGGQDQPVPAMAE
jgi:hypothetical protein